MTFAHPTPPPRRPLHRMGFAVVRCATWLTAQAALAATPVPLVPQMSQVSAPAAPTPTPTAPGSALRYGAGYEQRNHTANAESGETWPLAAHRAATAQASGNGNGNGNGKGKGNGAGGGSGNRGGGNGGGRR